MRLISCQNIAKYFKQVILINHFSFISVLLYEKGERGSLLIQQTNFRWLKNNLPLFSIDQVKTFGLFSYPIICNKEGTNSLILQFSTNFKEDRRQTPVIFIDRNTTNKQPSEIPIAPEPKSKIINYLTISGITPLSNKFSLPFLYKIIIHRFNSPCFISSNFSANQNKFQFYS